LSSKINETLEKISKKHNSRGKKEEKIRTDINEWDLGTLLGIFNDNYVECFGIFFQIFIIF
jgi:hypothetical protein